MDLEAIKKQLVNNVYHVDAAKNVAMHKHDEIFYCIKGEGFGVLKDSQVE